MLGVVLWSSASRLKAVIWCEDQQALAYLRDEAALSSPRDWPEAGDIVEVEIEIETDGQGDLRVVTRLDQQPGRMPVAPHLPPAPPPAMWMVPPPQDEPAEDQRIPRRGGTERHEAAIGAAARYPSRRGGQAAASDGPRASDADEPPADTLPGSRST